MKPTSNQKRATAIDIAELSFFHGAQGIPLHDTLREIEATHSKQQAALQEESVHRQKPLEATIDHLERKQPQVDSAWRDVQSRVGQHSPPVFTAWMVAAFAGIALFIDCILLAPGLDALAITNPVLQYIAAFGLAALSSVLFHLVHETFVDSAMDTATKFLWRALGAFAVVALLGWGILRGFQIRFSAGLNGNPLGRFLADHAVLSSVFFCFLTLAAPLVGSAAIFYAVPRIHAWLTWKRAHRNHEQLHAHLSDTQKKLEAERESLRQKLEQMAAKRTVWQACAAQYHERGQQRGARQIPHWLVMLKASLWSLGGLALGGVAGRFFSPLYIVTPAAAWIAAFLHYRRRRFHPSYSEFKQQENTRFAVSTDRPQVELPIEPKLLPAPAEEMQ